MGDTPSPSPAGGTNNFLTDLCKIALFLLMVIYVISSNVISKKHVSVK